MNKKLLSLLIALTLCPALASAQSMKKIEQDIKDTYQQKEIAAQEYEQKIEQLEKDKKALAKRLTAKIDKAVADNAPQAVIDNLVKQGAKVSPGVAAQSANPEVWKFTDAQYFLNKALHYKNFEAIEYAMAPNRDYFYNPRELENFFLDISKSNAQIQRFFAMPQRTQANLITDYFYHMGQEKTSKRLPTTEVMNIAYKVLQNEAKQKENSIFINNGEINWSKLGLAFYFYLNNDYNSTQKSNIGIKNSNTVLVQAFRMAEALQPGSVAPEIYKLVKDSFCEPQRAIRYMQMAKYAGADLSVIKDDLVKKLDDKTAYFSGTLKKETYAKKKAFLNILEGKSPDESLGFTDWLRTALY
ncbi:hypothetical protein AAIR98_001221 [Elusimicrobium simillimum]|uniref:hypothetical protein n=1 Tax=Elusimicrobium simillimum TaxID=3143438 RepID=UPI003C6EF7C4